MLHLGIVANFGTNLENASPCPQHGREVLVWYWTINQCKLNHLVMLLHRYSSLSPSLGHVAPQIQQSESLAWSCCSTDTAVWVPRLVISHQINKSSASQYLPALLCDFFQLSYVSCCIEVEYERIMLQDFSPNKKSLKNFLFFENVFMLKIMEDVILVS